MIGICNTFSELTPCNSHFRTLAEQVKIGVYEAGGFPLEFPVMSLGETLLRPTAMLYRNLASMDVEESIRGNPVDGVVLLMGCDKTTPSLVMGASSVDLPTIGVSGGPMLNGKWRGKELGSGTGVWSMSEQVRAGTLKLQDFFDAESCMRRSHGHCMTMGTASTMASMVEALGLGLPGNAAYPAVDGRRNVLARMAGRRIVDMVHEDQKLSSMLTRQAFENAIVTLAAIGGSTNAVIHLIAIAGRLGVELGDRRLRPARERAAVPRQPAAVGQAPDGGLLLRRRAAGGDEGDPRTCSTSTRSPPTARPSATTSTAPRTSTPRSSSRSMRRSRPRPESPSCAATSRRAARSSSRARRRRR